MKDSKPSRVIKRSIDGNVVQILPTAHSKAFVKYQHFKITKSGYLWGYFTDNLMQEKYEHNFGMIGSDFLIESVHDEYLMLKKKKPGLILHREFKKNKTGIWEKV